jgi:hypothetical protein
MPTGRFFVTASRPQAALDGSVATSGTTVFLLDALALEGALTALAFGLSFGSSRLTYKTFLIVLISTGVLPPVRGGTHFYAPSPSSSFLSSHASGTTFRLPNSSVKISFRFAASYALSRDKPKASPASGIVQVRRLGLGLRLVFRRLLDFVVIDRLHSLAASPLVGFNRGSIVRKCHEWVPLVKGAIWV